MTSPYARVAGTGSALGSRVVTNDDLAKFVDTDDTWIRERTGIGARNFATEGETTSTLAATAAGAALEASGLDPAAIDLTIVATCTGDQPLPSTASFVQARLGLSGGAFDLAAACAGFVYGTQVASAHIQSGIAGNVLVVGAEVLSRRLNFEDRSTCVLFGDGAGAAVYVRGDEPGVLGSVVDSDGTAARLLEVPSGGSAEPDTEETIRAHRDKIHMSDGRDVFKRAVVAMSRAASTLLEKSGLTPDDVTLLVPHQANARIIKSVAQRLSFPMDRVLLDLETIGNTSAASVGIAMDRAWRAGRLQPGDLVLTAAFGAGLAWGANLIRWTAPTPGAAR